MAGFVSAETIAGLIIGIVQGYLILGMVFAVVFVVSLVGRVDASAQGATWGFRVLIIPGIALLWPLMFIRVLRRQPPPVECNAHRVRAVHQSATQSARDSGR